MDWLNVNKEDFLELLDESQFEEQPVPLEVFLYDKYYLGNSVKVMSDLQVEIVRKMTQIFLPQTLIELYGEEEGKRIWIEETFTQLVLKLGKGSGKDFTSRVSFARIVYLLHCLKNPVHYFGKAGGTYITLLNIAVNADQARNVFFTPLVNMLKASPYFKEKDFHPTKTEVEFLSKPIKLVSGNSEAEAWEGLDILIVALDEIAAFRAQPMDAKILTPDGWTKMGNITVGDKVIGSDGKPTEVIGVYPQGLQKAFKVKTKDGGETICSDEHLWTVDAYSNGLRKTTKTIQLKDFDSLRVREEQLRYSLPRVEPVEFKTSQLPIDPYIMGILISEGNFTNHTVKFSTSDDWILEEIKRRLPDNLKVVEDYAKNNKYDYRIVCKERGGGGKRWHPYIIALENLGLWKKYAYEKWIPEIYLHASIEDRKLLLGGLADGDGTCSRRNVYTTTSDRLKEDIIYLIRSLGGSPHQQKYCGWKIENGERIYSRDKWQIHMRTPFNPFHLPRKQEVWKAPVPTLNRPIVEIEDLGYEIEMQCIKVANRDGLYITDDFLVTHNTEQQTKNNERGKLSAKLIYDMSINSVISRFPETGKVVCLSFPRYIGDPITQLYNETASDPHTWRLKAATWEVNPLITREMLEPQFRRNPVQAKARFMAEPPEAEDAFFRDPNRVRACFRGESYIENEGQESERRLLKEIPELSPLDENGRLKDWFRGSDGHERYIHIDLAKGVRDRASLVMTHCPGTRKILVAQDLYEHLPVVKMDLIKYWDAMDGEEIDFADIREFVVLLNKRFEIGMVTLDQWQSVEFMQTLTKRGIPCQQFSVRKSAYDTLATCFYDGRFSGYFNHQLVENELLKLILVNNTKVDHIAGEHDDGAYSLAGSVANTCMYMDVGNEIDIEILGLDDDWEARETQEAVEEDMKNSDGRRRRETSIYDDNSDWEFHVI